MDPINYPNGPFLRYPDGDYSEYVLTKSHCTGYCMRCTPERYVLTAGQFEEGCRSGNKLIEGKTVDVNQSYPSYLPKKVVHVIRNPFDNIVGRLHHQRKNWEHYGGYDIYLKLFSNTSRGFAKWCKFLDYSQHDSTTKSMLLDNFTKELFGLVPCAPDFYRYVQWHNLAIEASKDRPVYTLFYENYTDSFNETVSQLLDFVKLQPVNTPPPFEAGKTYPDYFSEDERYFTAELVRYLATAETWKLVQHYFGGILDDGEV
jgi:Sulfotransferase domain